jgi:hypothetical protein
MLKHGSRLRLRTGTELHEGRLNLRTADSMELRGAGGGIHLPLAVVDSLWVRRHHAGTGFLVGALLGLGGYLVFTGTVEDGSDNDELDNFFGGLVWAGSTLFGTITGALIPGWKRLYP